MALHYDAREEAQFSPFYHFFKFDDNDTDWQNSSLIGLSRRGEIILLFVVYGVISALVATLGIIGNSLSILVLTRKSMRSPISCLLCGLALTDLTACCLMIPFLCVSNTWSVMNEVNAWKGSHASLSVNWFLPCFNGMAITCVTSSVYFTVAVTTERYVAVCHPFRANLIFNIRRARFTVIGIIFFSVLYNLPRWWELESMEIHDPVNQALVGYRPIPSDLRKNEAYDFYYYDLSLMLLVVCFPLVTMCVLNAKIYMTVRRANRDRQMLSQMQKQENSLTRMLLIIVTFTLIEYTMAIVEVLGRKFIPACNGPCLELQVLRDFFIILNYSVNFFVYFVKSSKFQATLIALWPSCLRWTLRKLQSPPLQSSCTVKGTRSASVFSTTSIFMTQESQRTSNGIAQED